MAGFSDLSLKLSYWIVSHRQQFRRWWFVVLLALDFLLVVYVAITLTLYIGGAAAVQTIIDSSPRTVLSRTYLAQHQPTALVFSDTSVLARGDSRTDLAVRVQNANTVWAAVVYYAFDFQGETMASGSSYIAPTATAYVLGLNASLAETTADAAVKLTITNTDWIFTPARPEAVTPSFLVGKTGLVTTSQSGSAATVVTGKITNTAVVGWREVPVDVILTVGDQLVGVNQFTIRTWGSLENRDINVQWRRTFSGAAAVNILPVVNPFDQANVIR